MDKRQKILESLSKLQEISEDDLSRLLKMHTKPDGNLYRKSELLSAYKELKGANELRLQKKVLQRLTKRPVRTQSGVTPITVLTKPFPCPGKCIFCPSDVRMPKSYLSDEPGAQRAERNWFDPYLQTYNRLLALKNMGHVVEKAELIILGGTWSFYPEEYQVWFIKRCLEAMNNFRQEAVGSGQKEGIEKQYEEIYQKLKEKKYYAATNEPGKNKAAGRRQQAEVKDSSYNQVISKMYVAPEKKLGLDALQSSSWEELFSEQKRNETAKVRCVGMVIETRPDNISEEEVIRIRKLGCTKTQIGVQSLQDEVLAKNKRGHDVATTRKAFRLLRQAGFKIHTHWMANLYGSNVEKDKQDYLKLFSDPDFHPDELKIYPCSLIASAQLMEYCERGDWRPYNYEELLELISFAMLQTPEYCRLTRVIRDISSDDIVAGNKKTNFRQIARDEVLGRRQKIVDIREREIRGEQFSPDDAYLDIVEYVTSVSRELFLQFVLDEEKKLLAFLRLSLPKEKPFILELEESAIIREVHVYGQTQAIGKRGKAVQHLGFGKRLIKKAQEIAKAAGYKKLSVISGIGTREYYRKLGFSDGRLYQHTIL